MTLDAITVSTSLPQSGERVRAVVDHDHIAVRVGDRMCVAHRNWMSPEQAIAMAKAVLELAGGETDC